MSGIVPLNTADEISRCDDADVLLSALKKCASNILNNLERMANILRRLDELGVEVTIDHALIPYIRMIANGQLSASCFIACAADPPLLNKALKLPKAIQERIGRDEPFDVLDANGDSHSVRPSEMDPRELNQVFGESFVRSEDAQKRWLEGSKNKSLALTGKVRSCVTTSRLAAVAGTSVNGSKRCPSCGGRLLPDRECLRCKLANPNDRRELEKREDISSASPWHIKVGKDVDECAGWRERWEQLRAIKQSGDELGFHVDWIMSYCESSNNKDRCASTKLRDLLYAIQDKLARLEQ